MSCFGELDEWAPKLKNGSDLFCHRRRHQTCFAAQIPYATGHLSHHVFEQLLLGWRLGIKIPPEDRGIELPNPTCGSLSDRFERDVAGDEWKCHGLRRYCPRPAGGFGPPGVSGS